MRFFCVVLVVVLSLARPVRSQLDSLAEALFDANETSIEDDDILPGSIDINNTNRETLARFPFVSDAELTDLLKKRPFKSIRQLKPLVSEATYRQLQEIVIIRPMRSIVKLHASSRFQTVLEYHRPSADWPFDGNPFESMTRLRFNYLSSFSGGFLIQKDPGELSFTDHWTGYLSWQPSTIPLHLLCGGFIVDWGEGLVLSRPYANPKTSWTLSPKNKFRSHSRPFLSSNESRGFMGICASYQSGSGQPLLVFMSHQLRDALPSSDRRTISGFDQSGLHRTASEMEHANLVREKTIGIMIKIPVWLLDELGLCYIRTDYQPSINMGTDGKARTDFFRFTGDKASHLSLSYLKAHTFYEFKGEMAFNFSGAIAQQHGFSFLEAGSGIHLSWWHVPSGFQAPHGQTLSDTGPFAAGSQGFYCGLRLRNLVPGNIAGYFMMSKDLWRGYTAPMPGTQRSWYLLSDLALTAGTYLQLRYQGSLNTQFVSDKRLTLNKPLHKLRLQIEKRLNTQVRFRSRIEKSILPQYEFQEDQSGFNLMQEISWRPSAFLHITSRYSSFYTTDYQSRIYEFENGLPGVYSNFPLYGSGYKWYLFIRIYPGDSIKIWLKYRWFHLEDEKTLGSGPLEIAGNVRRDLQFQIEYSY